MQMIPVIVKFRQSAKLGRMVFEEYAKKQVLLFLKISAVKIMDQPVRIGILLLEEICRFITVDDIAVDHILKGIAIVCRFFLIRVNDDA